MVGITIDTTELTKVLVNTDQYSQGFIAGVHQGLPALLAKIGAEVTEAVKLFIDAQAAGNPAALHHVYEWYAAGSAGARLFDFSFAVGGNTVTITSSSSQSGSVARTADRPFYNKAEVMEAGQTVTITPYGSVLAFEAGGGTVFTPNTVIVTNPGGSAVQGSFQRVCDLFFGQYLTQSFLHSSGILSALQTPTAYAKYFAAGANGGGFGTGVQAGLEYMASADAGGVL